MNPISIKFYLTPTYSAKAQRKNEVPSIRVGGNRQAKLCFFDFIRSEISNIQSPEKIVKSRCFRFKKANEQQTQRTIGCENESKNTIMIG